MKIEKYDVGRRCEYAADRLRELGDKAPLGIERVLLLPIPTSRDGVHLTGSDVTVSKTLMDVTEGDAVIGYGISTEDAEIIKACGAVCIDLSNDGGFLAENARLTALGAVGYILTSYGVAADGLRFGIVGYGRIGQRLTSYLVALGADVTVYTSKNATRVALGSCGIKTEFYDRERGELLIVDGIDVLVNTAPTPLDKTFSGGILPDGLSVIELASGENFVGVRGVVKLPSLPERMYPESAAEIYYRAVLNGLGVVE